MTLSFSFAQSADCNTLTFTETTGNLAGGYSDGGNIAFSAVTNTLLEVKLPSGVTKKISKGYLPTQDISPNGTINYTAADFDYTSIPNGVYDVVFKVYATDTPSGSLVEGTEYIITGAGSSVTYDGTVYIENETFIATSVLIYTENAASQVNILYAEEQCNFLIYCGVKECLKKLMLQRCGSDCDCREDFHKAMNELVIDFNAAQLAFNALNYACANKVIQRLEKQCGGICNDCGC